MYNKHCRPAPRWTRYQNYWYNRLLYTGDATCITATAGPLHAGHIPNTAGIGAYPILKVLHVKQTFPAHSKLDKFPILLVYAGDATCITATAVRSTLGTFQLLLV